MRARKRSASWRGHTALGLLLLLCASLAAGLLPAASPAAAANCPNEAIREAQTSEAFPNGTTVLPDCMALEMVSPPKKFVQSAFEPSFSLDGERVLFRSPAGLANTPGLQQPFGDRYLADRSAGGWSTATTSPPTDAKIAGGAGSWLGGPNSFSPDLSRWILLGNTSFQTLLGIGQAFRGGLDGSFLPASPVLAPIEEGAEGRIETQAVFATLSVGGASVDSSTIVFGHESGAMSYFPEDPRSPFGGGGGSRGTNSYVAALRDGAPSLALLARDKDGKAWGGRCGTNLGGAGNDGAGNEINQGAISADGSRIYFTTRPAQPDSEGSKGPPCDTSNPLRIMRRLETPTGPEITELLPGSPSAPGNDLYQAASTDGTKVYFTSPRALVASDTDVAAEPCSSTFEESEGCDLYLYDSTLPEGDRVIQVSAGEAGSPSPGEGADVLSSITAVSGNVSHVYFVAQGVLTTDPNPEGEVAADGARNLYAYSRDTANPVGHTAFIGRLAATDGASNALWGSGQSFAGGAYAVPLLGQDEAGEEVGGDGHILVFASAAPLTGAGDDEDGGRSDVFRYDAAADQIERLSKAAPGGSDDGPFDVSVNPNGLSPAGNFAGEGRWVSEDGQTVAFATAEPLDPTDEDGLANPYFWKADELGRIAGAIPVSGFPNRPPTVSLDGRQVASAVTTALLPQDTDTASDVYLARVDGGFPLPPPPTACDPLQEGSCRGALQAPPPAGAPATIAFSGPGNPKPRSERCPKGTVRRKVGGKRGKTRCVRSRRKQQGRHQGSTHR